MLGARCPKVSLRMSPGTNHEEVGEKIFDDFSEKNILFSQSKGEENFLKEANDKLQHLQQYQNYIDCLPFKYEQDPFAKPLDDKNLSFDTFSVSHTAFNNTYAHIYTESETADTGLDFIVYVPFEIVNRDIHALKAHIEFYKAGGKRYAIIEI